MKNVQVLLEKCPKGKPEPSDFKVIESDATELKDGQARVKNLYISLDAGFRNWMDEDSGDEVLPAMRLQAPVMGLTLGEIVESRNETIKVGTLLMARLAWEQCSTVDSEDWLVSIEGDGKHPLSYRLGILGDTGMSAYFGLTDIGKPQPGETVHDSAAGGSVAGQIAKIKGARSVGFAGCDERCQRLIDELGYDDAINYKVENLHERVAKACPNGVDVYSDNVGGPLLEVVLEHINQGARIPFCRAVADYSASEAVAGPGNLFRIVAQCATLKGFMMHMQTDRYPEARGQLSQWLTSGDIISREHLYEGVEYYGIAFSDLFTGNNFGKAVVKVW